MTPEEEEGLPPDEGPDCFCEHARNVHETGGGACLACGCSVYRTGQEPMSPQPERRPPYAVDYSAGGHGFQIAVPGDVSVIAVDGALVIRHQGLPVLGISAVTPLIQKEVS